MSADEKSLMDMAYDERSDLAAFLETLTTHECGHLFWPR
jgi:hypothetical protein